MCVVAQVVVWHAEFHGLQAVPKTFFQNLAYGGIVLLSKAGMKQGWVVIFAVLLATCSVARATIVELANGDRISGRIISRSDRAIVVKSPTLGAVTIPLYSIKRISDNGASSSDAPSAPGQEGQPLPPVADSTVPPMQIAKPEASAAGESHKADASVVGERPRMGAPVPVEIPKPIAAREKYHGKQYLVPRAIDFVNMMSAIYNWKSSLRLGFNMYNGQTDARSNTVAFTTNHLWSVNELKLDVLQDYATSTSTTGVETVSRDKFKMSARYRYNTNTRIFFQSESQYGYSRVNNIDQDYLQSLGCGWRIVQNKLWYLCLTPSMSAQYQVISSVAQDVAISPTMYEEAEYRWTDTVKVHNELVALFPVTGGEPTYHFSISLQNKVIGNAFINIEYSFDYDGAVTDANGAMQQSLRTSFGVDF
jgi:hypothetical protein